MELTGKHFDEVLSGERLRYINENYARICSEKRPLLLSNRYITTRDVPLVCDRIVMPLSDDGARVNQCLAALTFHFPGAAQEWSGQWFGNSGNFDYANSQAEIIDERSPAA